MNTESLKIHLVGDSLFHGLRRPSLQIKFCKTNGVQFIQTQGKDEKKKEERKRVKKERF